MRALMQQTKKRCIHRKGCMEWITSCVTEIHVLQGHMQAFQWKPY